MKAKIIIISFATLVVGVLVGGFVLQSVKAEGIKSLPLPSFIEEFLTDEQKQQIQTEMQERNQLREKITEEATKTDEGIQITLKGQDQETIDKMHQMYDENGGKWKMGLMKGMKKGLMSGEGFVDENGNGICDHTE